MEFKKFLISGIPGAGKTTLGDNLTKYGFTHIEMEKCPAARMLLRDKQEIFLNFINSYEKIVISWGFDPKSRVDIDNILFLQGHGFKLIWLEGRSEFAFHYYFNRVGGKQPHIDNYFTQMGKIKEQPPTLNQQLHFVEINPFLHDGNFKNLYELLKEVGL